jgi:predicted nucleic acid-binding Zn ribbon protein
MTPIARFARWLVTRVRRCHTCGTTLAPNQHVYCSGECQANGYA